MTLRKIVGLIHPNATETDAGKYYTRYFQRMARGLSLDEAFALGTGPLQSRPRLAKKEATPPTQPLVPTLPVAPEPVEEIEIPEVEEVLEAEQEQSEYERALAYASTVQVCFRKYQGASLAGVLETEPSYIEWMRRKLIDNADEKGLKTLYGINKLYNDYPTVQAYIERATEEYLTKLNASCTVPASTTLGDNKKLQGLLIIDNSQLSATTVKEATELESPTLNLDGYSFQELEEMQALLAEEKEALREEQSALDKRRPVITKRLLSVHQEAQQIEEKLAALRPKAPAVSDHALVRYLERVMGMDVDKLRDAVVGGENCKWLFDYQTHGAGRYVVGDTHRVCIQNNTVVTVIPR